jgi:hypothetical protein
MPSYDYYCPANDLTIEVSHRMNETVSTWGELCEKSGQEPGSTPLESPVEKKITCCQISTKRSEPELPCGRDTCGCMNSGPGCHI